MATGSARRAGIAIARVGAVREGGTVPAVAAAAAMNSVAARVAGRSFRCKSYLGGATGKQRDVLCRQAVRAVGAGCSVVAGAGRAACVGMRLYRRGGTVYPVLACLLLRSLGAACPDITAVAVIFVRDDDEGAAADGKDGQRAELDDPAEQKDGFVARRDQVEKQAGIDGENVADHGIGEHGSSPTLKWLATWRQERNRN